MNEIYLCGNEPSWLQRMEHAIGCFQIKSDWEFTIACRAHSPRELLAVLENRGTKYGIYLLDVEYENEMNGLALGAAIRRLDPNAFLIYTAASGDMALETFRLRLRAVDFIVSGRCHGDSCFTRRFLIRIFSKKGNLLYRDHKEQPPDRAAHRIGDSPVSRHPPGMPHEASKGLPPMPQGLPGESPAHTVRRPPHQDAASR